MTYLLPLVVLSILHNYFPIQRQQDDNAINIQYTPLEYKFLKDFKAAVAQYDPQSPFVLAMLESLGKGKLIIPLDWESIVQAVLEGSHGCNFVAGGKKKLESRLGLMNDRIPLVLLRIS